MMIDFALDAERDEGLPPREAIYQACLLRFRPILMTTMAAMLGALPLMLGTGTGSELRQPLGIAIVGGLHRQPAADAVHDAGDLSLLRPPGGAPDRHGGRRAARRRRAGRMNISAPFIARPVATTLLTIGDRARRRDRLLRSCRSRRCRRWISRPSRCRRSLPGASPETMATSVADAARAPSRPDRRRHRDDVAELGSARRASRCSSTSTATSTAPRATCRRRSTPRAPTCRPACAATRPTARSIRPTRRS